MVVGRCGLHGTLAVKAAMAVNSVEYGYAIIQNPIETVVLARANIWMRGDAMSRNARPLVALSSEQSAEDLTHLTIRSLIREK